MLEIEYIVPKVARAGMEKQNNSININLHIMLVALISSIVFFIGVWFCILKTSINIDCIISIDYSIPVYLVHGLVRSFQVLSLSVECSVIQLYFCL